MCCTSSRADQSGHWIEWRAPGKPATGRSRTLSQNQSEPSQTQQWPREMEFRPGAGSTTRLYRNTIRLKAYWTKDIYLRTYRPFSLRIQPWPKAEVALIELIKTWLLKGFRINNLAQFWRHLFCCSVYFPLWSRKTSVSNQKNIKSFRCKTKFHFIATLLWYFIWHVFSKTIF